MDGMRAVSKRLPCRPATFPIGDRSMLCFEENLLNRQGHLKGRITYRQANHWARFLNADGKARKIFGRMYRASTPLKINLLCR